MIPFLCSHVHYLVRVINRASSVFGLFLVLLMLLVSCSAFAAEGRIPISEPVTITAAGSYVVTSDFTTSGTAITINASHVTIDLDGHTITSTGTTADIITNGTTNSKDIHIFGGKLSGGNYQIKLVATTGGEFSVKNVSMLSAPTYGQGLWIEGGTSATDGIKVQVRGNVLSGTQSDAITVKNATVGVITENEVSDIVFNAGILLQNCRNILVSGNSVYQGDFGIVLSDSTNNQVVDNRLSMNSSEAITLHNSHSNLVERNASMTNSSGIYLDNANDNIIVRNKCTDNDSSGLFIYAAGSRNTIRENVFSAPGYQGDGIVIKGATSIANLIEGNFLENSNGYGLHIYSGAVGNIYGSNRTAANTTGSFSIISGNLDAGNNFCAETGGTCP